MRLSDVKADRYLHDPKLGPLITQALNDRTENGDVALVTLMNYYLGEDLDEDIAAEITSRDKRCLRLLRQHMQTPPKFAGSERFKMIERDPETRTRYYDFIIDAVERGETLGSD